MVGGGGLGRGNMWCGMVLVMRCAALRCDAMLWDVM